MQVSARDANALIDRRTFSWTALLNYFQQTLPADVRIMSVTPQVDDDGRMLVAIQVMARRAEDLSEFADALETTGAFSNVLAVQQSVEEDGSWRAGLQGYYSLPPKDAAPTSPKVAAGQAATPPSTSEDRAPTAPAAATAEKGAQ